MAGNAGLGIVQIQVMGLEPVEECRLDGVTGYLLPQKGRGTRKIPTQRATSWTRGCRAA